MKSNILLILFACLCLSACKSSTEQTTATKPQSIILERIDAPAFAAKIEALPNEQILDVRTPEEVADGTIENAIAINYHDSDFATQVLKLDKDKPVMVYCAGGVRSAKAAKILKKQGFKEIYDLKTGYSGWTQK